jgi:ankyrin repeat protein
MNVFQSNNNIIDTILLAKYTNTLQILKIYINYQDENSNTCLHHAYNKENYELIIFLISNGADPNIFNIRSAHNVDNKTVFEFIITNKLYNNKWKKLINYLISLELKNKISINN